VLQQRRANGVIYGKTPQESLTYAIANFLSCCGFADGDFHVLQIGSIAGVRVPENEMYAYSASKAAVHHLSRNMAGRLGWEGITSNSIAPGPFESKSAQAAPDAPVF
jgi:NAD(P)-dependent dehydrogenase (short-subunit alcohol dehydrogenase family)